MSMRSHKDHGTVTSYVVGFVLSLAFTVIPYLLVVNKVLSGNSLLVAVLGVAIVQMFIQIFFFLHLGRGPKPLYNVVFFFATAGLIVIVVGASLFIMQNLYRTMSPKELVVRQAQRENISQINGQATGACNENKQSHLVTISAGVVTPAHIAANRCDTLTFVNYDSKRREIAFGNHPDHTSYGGEDEIILEDSSPETITLNEVGDFSFHDHLEPSTNGTLTVTSNQSP